MRSYYVDDRKRAYYLSMEFLTGRASDTPPTAGGQPPA